MGQDQRDETSPSINDDSYDANYLPFDDDYDIISDSDPNCLFDNSIEADTASDNESESVLEELDEKSNDDELFDDEVRRPPEYYIAASTSLDHNNSRPRLFIELTAEFTKGFLGMNDVYVSCFPVPLRPM
jgi:hypothetical protein